MDNRPASWSTIMLKQLHVTLFRGIECTASPQIVHS
jgi:hypothetical protein